jgi:hypothetical protein
MKQAINTQNKTLHQRNKSNMVGKSINMANYGKSPQPRKKKDNLI